MESDTRTLIDHLFLRAGGPDRITEAHEQMRTLLRAVELETIIDVDPGDGSAFAAFHLVEPARSYVGYHNEPSLLDAAHENQSTFLTLGGFEERLSRKGYPRSFSIARKKRAGRTLRASIEGAGATIRASLIPNRPVTDAKPSGRSGLMARVPGYDDGRLADAYLAPFVEQARERGFSAVAFSLPHAAIDALPEGHDDPRRFETHSVVTYRFDPKRTTVNLEGDLFENLLEAYRDG